MSDTEKTKYLLETLTDTDIETLAQEFDKVFNNTYTDNKTKH